MIEFIQDYIEPSSTIIINGWPSYNELVTTDHQHKVLKATVKEENEEILPKDHRIASLLKRWL